MFNKNYDEPEFLNAIIHVYSFKKEYINIKSILF